MTTPVVPFQLMQAFVDLDRILGPILPPMDCGKIDFLLFTCSQVSEIISLVKKAEQCDERVEMPVKVTATVPDKLGEEPVAEFVLTLSLKKR